MSLLGYGFGEYISKRWVLGGGPQLVVLLVAIYAVSGLMWLPALKQKNSLILLGILWLVGAMVINIMLGFFVFHEHIRLIHWVGVAFAFVACLLLSVQ